MSSATSLAAGTSRIGRILISRLRSVADGMAQSPQLWRAGFACRDFPARRNEFPVPDHRESVATTAERLRNLGAERAPGGFSLEGFPCIFPVDQGSDSRDEFAPDCAHRHSVCGCGDFPTAVGNSPKNLRDSAGSWPSSSGVSEPETAGSGSGRRHGPCLSLLPSWAVRFRRRFPAKMQSELNERLLAPASEEGRNAAEGDRREAE